LSFASRTFEYSHNLIDDCEGILWWVVAIEWILSIYRMVILMVPDEEIAVTCDSKHLISDVEESMFFDQVWHRSDNIFQQEIHLYLTCTFIHNFIQTIRCKLYKQFNKMAILMLVS
jgi:hypothetical protein